MHRTWKSLRKPCLCILLIVILSLTATGCGLQDLLMKKDKNSSSEGTQKQADIGMVLDESDPNLALIRQGIEESAQKDNLKVVDLSAGSGQDSSNQNSDMQTGKTQGGSNQSSGQSGESGDNSALQGAKVIIYQGSSADPVLNQAQKANIPVVALGQVPGSSKLSGIVYPNQEGVGEGMANMLQASVSEGDVVILQENPDDPGAQEALTGSKAVLAKNPKIKVNVIANPAQSESGAKQAFTAFVEKDGEKLKGVLAYSEKLAAGAYEVLKNAKLDKKVVLIGGQANLQSFARISAGTQKGDIDTSPYLQGVQVYQMASQALKKQPVAMDDSVVTDQGMVPVKEVPVKVVDAGNVQMVEKNYSKALTQAEQAQKQAAASSNGQNGQKAQTQTENASADQGSGQKSGASQDSGGQDSSGQGSGSSSNTGSGGNAQATPAPVIPSGTASVKEKITTETTREYLDKSGKVISTEQSTVEQNRTVPPDTLKQENGQGTTAGGSTQNKSSEQSGSSSDQGSGGGDSGGKSKSS